jgi:energy-coupling factor transporter ATP-binding protein EcfA2
VALIFYNGPSFSGRSEALRAFAWSAGPGGSSRSSLGQYLHPDLVVNLSGFGHTVAGERLVHLSSSRPSLVSNANLLAVRPEQTLSSLSGGERARLLLECALHLSPRRLSLDGALEQLDSTGRREVLGILKGVGKEIEVHAADNNPDDLIALADGVLEFRADPHLIDFTTRLAEFSTTVGPLGFEAPVLTLENMSFRYPRSRRDIFSGVHFKFEPRRPFVLKAPNGAGKSTLAKLLAGVLRPTRGCIQTTGPDPAKGRADGAACFYALQNPRDQIFGAKPEIYLDAVVSARRQNRGVPSLTSAQAIDAFGMSAFAAEDIYDLPFIALKRLSLAGAFVSSAPWLFLDEPALGLDQAGRANLVCFVEALCRGGRGIVIATHGQEFDSVPNAVQIRIEDGRLVSALGGRRERSP